MYCADPARHQSQTIFQGTDGLSPHQLNSAGSSIFVKKGRIQAEDGAVQDERFGAAKSIVAAVDQSINTEREIMAKPCFAVSVQVQAGFASENVATAAMILRTPTEQGLVVMKGREETER